MRKDTVLEILEAGATIKFPYKGNLKDWYSEISVTKLNGCYTVSPDMTFYSAESAVSYFLGMVLSPKNSAYVMDRLARRGIICDGLDPPGEEYIAEFLLEKKRVSEEFKKLDIVKLKKGDSSEIEDSLKKIIDRVVPGEFPEKLKEDLRQFANLYALNSPYIGVSFCYSLKTQSSNFRQSISIDELTPDKLKAAKNLVDFIDPSNAEYLFTELTISYYPKKGGSRIRKTYELKI